MGVRAIQQLAALTAHPHWAGSTAFSKDPLSKLAVGNFRALAGSAASRNELHDNPEQAIAFLEALKPGLTTDVNWDAELAD